VAGDRAEGRALAGQVAERPRASADVAVEVVFEILLKLDAAAPLR
jgi:hypothetical protein